MRSRNVGCEDGLALRKLNLCFIFTFVKHFKVTHPQSMLTRISSNVAIANALQLEAKEVR